MVIRSDRGSAGRRSKRSNAPPGPRSTSWRRTTLPELPEVETIRRHIASELEERRIHTIDVRHPRMLRYQPSGRLPRLTGRRVEKVRRTGKYLIIELEGDVFWITHLGMSGRVEIVSRDAPESPHTHVVCEFDDGMQFRLVDPRTFGFVQVLRKAELEESSVARLGPDALTDGAGRLGARLEGRRAPIKSLLLDQRVLAGIGNIYADEILYRARIRPDRPAGGLSPSEVRRLQSAVRPVLRDGLMRGGTSLEDLAYLLPDGSAGEFLERLRVYGREDEPCLRCGTPITRTVISGRSSFWCSSCQT